MKNFMRPLALSLFTLPFTQIASAAHINSASYNASTRTIDLNVSYSGGCGDHDFSLDQQACMETFPVRCTATLVERTNDNCEAYITTTVKLTLEEAGVSKSYYSQGTLKIEGDDNTSATIRLPEID